MNALMSTTSRRVLALAIVASLFATPAAMAQRNQVTPAQVGVGADEDAADQRNGRRDRPLAADSEESEEGEEDTEAGESDRETGREPRPDGRDGGSETELSGDDAPAGGRDLEVEEPAEDDSAADDSADEETEEPAPEVAAAEPTECDTIGASPFDGGAISDAVPPDAFDAEATIEACTEALESDPDNPRLKLQLGRAFDADRQYDKALDWYEQAAEAGYAEAMWALGNMYRDGKRVRRNYETAHDWYEKGAAAGNGNAMMALGGLYFNGWGVDKDYDAAYKWYESASAAGHPGGDYRIGFFYENSYSVQRDYERAYEYYSKAADAGYGDAMYGISNLYRNGHYGDGDERLAYDWLVKSVDSGSRLGYHALGAIYDGDYDYAPHDGKRAAELFYRAIRSGQRYTLEQFATNADAYGGDTRQEIQRYLRDDGYYRGRLDADFGPETLEAIAYAADWDPKDLLDLYYESHGRYEEPNDDYGAGYEEDRKGGDYNSGGSSGY